MAGKVKTTIVIDEDVWLEILRRAFKARRLGVRRATASQIVNDVMAQWVRSKK